MIIMLKGARLQSDRMARVFVQFLSTYNKENLSNGIRNLTKQIKKLANAKLYHKQKPKTLKMLPKWRNFTKSGHTARLAGKDYLVLQIIQQFWF